MEQAVELARCTSEGKETPTWGCQGILLVQAEAAQAVLAVRVVLAVQVCHSAPEDLLGRRDLKVKDLNDLKDRKDRKDRKDLKGLRDPRGP